MRDRRGPQVLSLVGAVFALVGFLLILVAWNGTAHTPLVFEQIPYLVSGGQLGTAHDRFRHRLRSLLEDRVGVGAADPERRHPRPPRPVGHPLAQLGTALVVMGGFLFFSSWLTVLVQDQRETHRLLGEILTAQLATSSTPRPLPTRLVATAHGDMVHRDSCRVVAGRTDLRPGDLATMRPCGICTPDESATAA